MVSEVAFAGVEDKPLSLGPLSLVSLVSLVSLASVHALPASFRDG